MGMALFPELQNSFCMPADATLHPVLAGVDPKAARALLRGGAFDGLRDSVR